MFALLRLSMLSLSLVLGLLVPSFVISFAKAAEPSDTIHTQAFFKEWSVKTADAAAAAYENAARELLWKKYVGLHAIRTEPRTDPLAERADATYLEAMRNVGRLVQNLEQLRVYGQLLAAHDELRNREPLSAAKAEFLRGVVASFAVEDSMRAEAMRAYLSKIDFWNVDNLKALLTKSEQHQHDFNNEYDFFLNASEVFWPSFEMLQTPGQMARLQLVLDLTFAGGSGRTKSENLRAALERTLNFDNQELAAARVAVTNILVAEPYRSRYLSARLVEYEARIDIYERSGRSSVGVDLPTYTLEQLTKNTRMPAADRQLLQSIAPVMQSTASLAFLTMLMDKRVSLAGVKFEDLKRIFEYLNWYTKDNVADRLGGLDQVLRRLKRQKLSLASYMGLAHRLTDNPYLMGNGVEREEIEIITKDRSISLDQMPDQFANVDRILRYQNHKWDYKWLKLNPAARLAVMKMINKAVKVNGKVVSTREFSFVSESTISNKYLNLDDGKIRQLNDRFPCEDALKSSRY